MTLSAKGDDEPLPSLQAKVNGGQNTAVTWKRIRALASRRAASGQRFAPASAQCIGAGSPRLASLSRARVGRGGILSLFVIRLISVPCHDGGKDFRAGKIYRQETQNPAEPHKRRCGANLLLCPLSQRERELIYRASAIFSESKSKVNSLVSPAPREIFSSRVMVLPSFSSSTLMV